MTFPTGNVITGVATVIAVVISNKLSSSQSGQAKLWELRRQTYGVILSELATVERLCASVDAYLEEDAYRYFQSSERESMDARILQHMALLSQRFSDDYLIISTTFLTLFEDFKANLQTGSLDDAFPVSEEHFGATVRKHRPLLLAQGRTEIAVGQDFSIYLSLSGWRHSLKSAAAFIHRRLRLHV